jgi:hypothetical protein
LKNEEKKEFTAEAAEVRRGSGGLFSSHTVRKRSREVGVDVRMLGECFFDLGGEFEGEGVEALRQIANELEEIVVGD